MLDADIVDAKLFLRIMYYSGEGVPEDREKGIAFLDELIAIGNVEAIKIKKELISEEK